MSTATCPLRRCAAASAAALALVAVSLAGPQGPTPFTAGERFGYVSGDQVPWLPDSLTFAAGDELVVSASRGVAGGLAVHSAHGGSTSPALGFDPRFAAAFGATLVAAGERADAVYALAQYPAPDLYSRRVELTRHDPVAAARTGAFTPVWTRGLDLTLNGPSRLACDAAGELVVAAAYDDHSGLVRVDRVEGAGGALLARTDFAAPGLARLALSGDGRRVAVSAGTGLWILDEHGAIVAQRTLASSAQALGFSHDGATLAVGGVAGLLVLRESLGGAYPLFATFHAAPQELAAVTAVSRDGAALGVAWWDASTGTSVRMELWDVAPALRTAHYAQLGTPVSRQNLPSAVALDLAGRRAAFGLWGDGGSPEVVLLEAGRALPRMAFDLPGSVRALDLDETGTRIAVAHKNVHNSQWGAAGAVRLLDTGERGLELLGAPTVGGTLRAATRRTGATGYAFFALGQPLAAGAVFPGVQGALLLQRGTMTVHVAPLDPSGRADLALPVANDVSLAGTRLHVQGAFRTAGGLALTAERLDALIL